MTLLRRGALIHRIRKTTRSIAIASIGIGGVGGGEPAPALGRRGCVGRGGVADRVEQSLQLRRGRREQPATKRNHPVTEPPERDTPVPLPRPILRLRPVRIQPQHQRPGEVRQLLRRRTNRPGTDTTPSRNA